MINMTMIEIMTEVGIGEEIETGMIEEEIQESMIMIKIRI